MLKFICYPKCTTCQKAKKWLDDNKIDYELRDIKLDNPTLNELTDWYKKSGLPLKKFFNTSGLLYKSLDLKNKLPEMTEDEMFKLLSTDGMLVKRPLLIGEDFVLVGFKDTVWAETLKEHKNKAVVPVVAALIWDNGKFMICQRPKHKTRGLMWEFVGGKVEPGETKAQALIRECREELDVTLSVGDVFMDVVHEYPDITVHLTLFNATVAEGIPQKLEHNDIKWITPKEIPNYTFCPANDTILERIIEVYDN